MFTKLSTFGGLKQFVNTLSEDQLKQKLRFWGDEIGGTFEGVQVLQDDQINPFGDGCEDRSPYLPGGEHYDPQFDMENEPIVLSKGAIMFEIEKDSSRNKFFEKCPTCDAPTVVQYGSERVSVGLEAKLVKKHKYVGRL